MDHDDHDDHDEHRPGRTSPGIRTGRVFDGAAFEVAVTAMLRACGVDDEELRQGHMRNTPRRVAELWSERLLSGQHQDLGEVLGEGFADPRTDLVVIRGISVHGICPHHLVPFRGVAHVAYLPGGRLHGFGRIARLVDACGHRFTYQEWMTRDIADALVTHGRAAGAAVIVECAQLCLLLGENRRGDERVLTTAFAGVFNNDDARRAEVLRTLELPRSL